MIEHNKQGETEGRLLIDRKGWTLTDTKGKPVEKPAYLHSGAVDWDPAREVVTNDKDAMRLLPYQRAY